VQEAGGYTSTTLPVFPIGVLSPLLVLVLLDSLMKPGPLDVDVDSAPNLLPALRLLGSEFRRDVGEFVFVLDARDFWGVRRRAAAVGSCRQREERVSL